ncbi:MAG: hypothetical protein PHE16_00105 [Aliarcobacter sp.]|nr:hypothetical protein [Aliarcobacter sp.]
MKKILILFLILFNLSFASRYYCTSYDNEYTYSGTTGTTSYIDFGGTDVFNHTSYYKTQRSYYESMTGCIDEIKFKSMQVKSVSYSREQELICSQQHNFDGSEAMYACIDNVQNLLSAYSDLMLNYSDASPVAYSDMKCNELYFELETNNVYSCNPNTGEKKLIENGSITPDGNLSCGSSNYASNIPNMVIGGSGYNWNSQDCVSKIHNEEIDGGTITTNYDDNGNIESSNYKSSTNGNTYSVENTENGLIGTIKDSTGKIIDTGSVTKDDNGDYHYTSNSSNSGSSTSLNDFYKYTPSNYTNSGGTNSGGSSGNTNNTNIDGLNNNYVTPTTGANGNSQTDVMNSLKTSLDANTNALNNNANSNTGLNTLLNGNGIDSNAQAVGDSAYFGMSGLVSDIQSSYSSFNKSINDTKSVFENGLNYTPLQLNSNVSRCLNVHVGNTFVKFDFISVLSTIKPYFQMFFQIFFLFLTIKITIKSISVMRGA